MNGNGNKNRSGNERNGGETQEECPKGVFGLPQHFDLAFGSQGSRHPLTLFLACPNGVMNRTSVSILM